MIIGMDWGGYAYDALQIEALAAAGLGFFISQAGGVGTPKLLARAEGCELITGTYYWNSALKSAQSQIDEYSRLIEQDKPDMIILDYEHYWKNWTEYWDAIAGKLPWAQVQRLPPEKISDNAWYVAEGIRRRWQGKYFLIYTAAWFVNGYSPGSSAWIKDYALHVASYPDYGLKKYTLSLPEILSGKFMELKAGLQTISDWTPTLPAGLNQWDLWQYSSRIMVPGEYYAYDWDYWPGTLDELKVKCGLLAAPTPEPSAIESLVIALNSRVGDLEYRVGVLEGRK